MSVGKIIVLILIKVEKGYTQATNFRIAFGNASLNAKHEILRKAFFCRPQILIFLNNLFAGPKYIFFPK